MLARDVEPSSPVLLTLRLLGSGWRFARQGVRTWDATWATELGQRPATCTPSGVPQTPRGARSLSSSPAADNIRAIVELERRARHQETRSERLGRRISEFVGSLRFVWLQTVSMLVWMLWNASAPPAWRFDPYPYGLLTFIVSLEGVFIATFVLIAQNQLSRQSDERDHLNLQVDLLSEQEMTIVLRVLQRISERLGIPPDDEERQRTEQLRQQTDVLAIAEELRENLPKSG